MDTIPEEPRTAEVEALHQTLSKIPSVPSSTSADTMSDGAASDREIWDALTMTTPASVEGSEGNDSSVCQVVTVASEIKPASGSVYPSSSAHHLLQQEGGCMGSHQHADQDVDQDGGFFEDQFPHRQDAAVFFYAELCSREGHVVDFSDAGGGVDLGCIVDTSGGVTHSACGSHVQQSWGAGLGSGVHSTESCPTHVFSSRVTLCSASAGDQRPRQLSIALSDTATEGRAHVFNLSMLDGQH